MSKKVPKSCLNVWLKEAHRDTNFQTELVGDDKTHWRLSIPAKSFTHSGFQVDLDGTWTSVCETASAQISDLLQHPNETRFYDLNGTLYEIQLEDKQIIQTNLTTKFRRSIRSFGLQNDINMWFATHQPKEAPAIIYDFTFPSSFPTEPPFVRIVRPRFQYRTGHVTIGGSICAEILTTSKWDSNITLTGLVLLLKDLIYAGDAQVDMSTGLDYTEEEAKSAFARSASTHDWKV